MFIPVIADVHAVAWCLLMCDGCAEQAVVQNTLHHNQVLYRAPELQAAAERERERVNGSASGAPAVRPSKSDVKDFGDHKHDSGAAGAAAGLDAHDPLGGYDFGGEPAVGKPKRFLMPLWSFGCSLTRDMHVTCMDWNHRNHVRSHGRYHGRRCRLRFFLVSHSFAGCFACA
jgi:hypothetical protein